MSEEMNQPFTLKNGWTMENKNLVYDGWRLYESRETFPDGGHYYEWFPDGEPIDILISDKNFDDWSAKRKSIVTKRILSGVVGRIEQGSEE